MKEVTKELLKLFEPGTIFFWLLIIGIAIILIAIIYVIIKAFKKED